MVVSPEIDGSSPSLAIITILNQRTPNRRLRKELNDLRNPTSYLLAKAAPAVDSGVDHLLRLFTLQFVAQSDKTQKFRAGILKGAADALGVGKGATAYLAAVAGGQLDHGDRELFKRACEASREVETRFTGKRRTVRDRAMIVLAANAEVLRKDKFGSDFEVVP